MEQKQEMPEGLEIPVQEMFHHYHTSEAFMNWLGVDINEYMRDHLRLFMAINGKGYLTEEGMETFEPYKKIVMDKYQVPFEKFLQEKNITIEMFRRMKPELQYVIRKHKTGCFRELPDGSGEIDMKEEETFLADPRFKGIISIV